MNIRLLSLASGCLISLTCVTTANSALLSRLGGQAYYDDALDITWLANANLAATLTFGVSGINADGSMSWSTANDWIAALNTDGGTGHLGVNSWRLPYLSPIDGASFDTTLTNNASTDRGYAASQGWLDAAGNPVSEMGHMFYVNLGNLGRRTPNDSKPYKNAVQSGWGLANTGPFSNMQPGFYWFGVASAPDSAWHFNLNSGAQSDSFDISSPMFAWAVHAGDVTAVPVPAAMWLLGSGLVGLAGITRGRKLR